MRISMLLLYWLLLGTLAWGTSAVATVLPADADGWHTWQVDEPSASTQMCCFAWKHGDRSVTGCKLDGHTISFSDGGECAAAPGTIQVYVRVENGRPKDVRVLSSNCPVTTESELTDHGLVSTDENIGWFRSVVEDSRLTRDVREEALFALVLSESDSAYAYLDKILSSR